MGGWAASAFLRKLFLLCVCAVAAISLFDGTGLAQSTVNTSSVITDESRALIEQGRSQLQENNHSAAVTTLTRVIRNEKVPPEWLAIAFFYRGIAYRSTNEQDSAVADFVNALWLQTLPPQIAAQAHFHRAQIYVAQGKFDEALADFDDAQNLAPDEPRIKQARDAAQAYMNGETTGSVNGVPLSREDAVRNALGNGAVLAPAPFMERPRAVVSSSSETRETTTQPQAPSQAPAEVPQNASNGPTGIQIQLGALGSRALAESEWARVREQHRDLLGRMQVNYEAVTRNGRTITRLRAGYASNLMEARNLCAKLVQRGQDCIVVSR